MRFFFIAFLSLIISISVIGQEKFSIYGDAGGASPVMSVNIDKRFSNSNRGFGVRVGIGMVPGQTYVYDARGSY